MTELQKYKIFQENILLITFGGTKKIGLGKTRITKFVGSDGSFFQEERIINNKAYHQNINSEMLEQKFNENMYEDFKNAVIYTDNADFYIRKSKKGNLSVMKRPATKANIVPKLHNVEKNYLIPEGGNVPFLVELGIMSDEGQVFKKHYSKFRQINRFLELLDADYNVFINKSEINVYDLCCGKGYLTLAVQYYFENIKKQKVNIIGIDLKSDVIIYLQNLVNKLELSNIEFKHGDIKDADIGKPDLVVALHACDIATDIALAKAAGAGTGLIMSVPCCQHELFKQIQNDDLDPMLKYGIMKDKFTELATNTLRGLALEAVGYNVRMIEFTSLEHTAKNIMIKAVKTNYKNTKAENEYINFSKMLNVESSAEEIIGNSD